MGTLPGSSPPVIETRVAWSARINPEYAESVAEIYNPLALGSRFGVTIDRVEQHDLLGIEAPPRSANRARMLWARYGGGRRKIRQAAPRNEMAQQVAVI